MFHEHDGETEMAFRFAIIRENLYNSRLEFVPLVQIVDPLDSFQAEKVGTKSTQIDGIKMYTNSGIFWSLRICRGRCGGDFRSKFEIHNE